MASVPHKVVCVLGLDADSLLPSTRTLDDLRGESSWVGDTDGRLATRADLLSAVMSAREHLVVTCTSTDVNNNREVPLAVVLEELFEVIGSVLGVSAKEARRPGAGVYVAHPRQAFDPSNFATHSNGRTLSYDPIALKGALSVAARADQPLGRGDHVSRRVLLDHRLDQVAAETGTVELAELVRFFTHPAREFLQNSLGVTLPAEPEEADEELPAALSHLDSYSIGQALLDAGLQGDLPDEFIDADGLEADAMAQLLRSLLEVEMATGVLPPLPIARPDLTRIRAEVAEMLKLADSLGVRGAARGDHAIHLSLPSGTRLIGSVETFGDGPDVGPVDIRFARLSPKHRLQHQIQLLALVAMDPTAASRGVLLTRGAKKGKPAECIVSAVAGDDPDTRARTAATCLDLLVEQYQDGLGCPLPLFPKTSFAAFEGKSITSAWTRGARAYPQEGDDPYNALAFGSPTAAQLRGLAVAEFTLDSEAQRLWGSLDRALINITEESLVS